MNERQSERLLMAARELLDSLKMVGEFSVYQAAQEIEAVINEIDISTGADRNV